MSSLDWRDVVSEIKDDIKELKGDVKNLIGKVSELEGRITEIQRKNALVKALMKYVVLPLILILGGLVGIKLVLPGL